MATSTVASTSRLDIEEFNGMGYELWKLKMENLLEQRNQWLVVQKEKKPNDVSQDEWHRLDKKAWGTVRLCLLDSILLNVAKEETAYKLWNQLGEIYQAKSMVNKLYLKRKLFSMKMREGESVAEHLNSFNLLLSWLDSVDV